jgi:hypothetical protein
MEEKKKADSCHKLDVTTFASLEGFLIKKVRGETFFVA